MCQQKGSSVNRLCYRPVGDLAGEWEDFLVEVNIAEKCFDISYLCDTYNSNC